MMRLESGCKVRWCSERPGPEPEIIEDGVIHTHPEATRVILSTNSKHNNTKNNQKKKDVR